MLVLTAWASLWTRWSPDRIPKSISHWGSTCTLFRCYFCGKCYQKWTVPWLPVCLTATVWAVCCWCGIVYYPGPLPWSDVHHLTIPVPCADVSRYYYHHEQSTWSECHLAPISGEWGKGIGKCLYKSGSKMKYNGLVKQLTKSLSVFSPPINNCLQNVNFHFKKRICASELAWHKGGLSS